MGNSLEGNLVGRQHGISGRAPAWQAWDPSSTTPSSTMWEGEASILQTFCLSSSISISQDFSHTRGCAWLRACKVLNTDGKSQEEKWLVLNPHLPILALVIWPPSYPASHWGLLGWPLSSQVPTQLGSTAHSWDRVPGTPASLPCVCFLALALEIKCRGLSIL
jgi:hypothetical protein